MACARVFVVAALALLGTVSAMHHHRHHPHADEALEETGGKLARKVAQDLMVEWTAGATYDFATADHRGSCIISAPVLNTWYGQGGHRVVGDDMLRMCEQRALTYTSRSSQKRHWNVHATHWTLFSDCLFDFEWQFQHGATVYDCSPEAITRQSGADAYATLRETYPDDKFFSLYVGGIRVAITDCDLNRHKGYVKVYPSLPPQAYSSNPSTIANYEANPVFYVNVEGWTGGDCSGSKGPGVRWVFTYKVNLAKEKITYISKFTEGTHRPYSEVSTFVPYLESGARRAGKRLVLTYEEKTKGYAEELGIVMDG